MIEISVSNEFMVPMLIKHGEAAIASDDPDATEWQFMFTPETNTQSVFMNVLKKLRSDSSYTEKITAEQLYVTAVDSDNTLIIEGVPHISRYCDKESATGLPSKTIKTTELASIESLPEELPLEVTSSVVTRSQLPAATAAVAAAAATAASTEYASATLKNYVISKAFTYVNKTKDIQFVIKMVRAVEAATDMVSSHIGALTPTYTYGLILGPSYIANLKAALAVNKPQAVIGTILEVCLIMIQMLTNQVYPLSRAQQREVMDEYSSLIGRVMEAPRKWHGQAEAQAQVAGAAGHGGATADEPSYHFLAPKPITLERMHLVEPGHDTYGIQSIQKGYAVTDKADGERMLMYIDKVGDAYMINNTFAVFYTGLKTTNAKYYKSLLDGEFILTSQRRDHGKDMFAVFDIYFFGGVSVMALPLIADDTKSGSATGGANGSNRGPSSRYSAMQEICTQSYWKDTKTVELKCKTHIAADGHAIFEACNGLLTNAAGLPYDIDGLIFTPRDLCVFGYYPGRVVSPIPLNVKWDRVLKWKPSHMNSIDFLVKSDMNATNATNATNTIVKDSVNKNVSYRRFSLLTAYSANQWEPITPMEGLQRRYDKHYDMMKKKAAAEYRAEIFKPPFFPGAGVAELVLDRRGLCVCEDKTVVETNTIVEFAYDPTKTDVPIARRWNPMRVREDKTRIYTQNKTIAKTANDLKVAMNIWRSIHNPVTREHISGVVPVPPLEERDDDVYYARDVPRQHLLSVNMLNFHVQGIKKELYSKSPERKALLELACGKAGDMQSWNDCNFKFVMGVDLSSDNIANPRDGAWARVLYPKHKRGGRKGVGAGDGGGIEHSRMDVVFVVGDCALPLHNGEAAGDDEESKQLLNMLYSKKAGNMPKYATKYLSGRALQGFNMVSCMFAIHYFFRSEETLDGFLKNVAGNLVRGGVFITTFMDGTSVDELLHSPEAADGFVEGRKAGIPLWAITKRYQEFSKENCWGKHIDVFLENINQRIPEFLVNYDRLLDKAQEHGLELKESGMFRESFDKILSGAKRTKPSFLENAVLALEADPVQTKFSFLNRWVVFKKV